MYVENLSVCREFVNYFSFLRRTKMCGLEGREFYLLLSFFKYLKSFFNNRCKKEQFRLYSPCKRSYVSVFLIIVAQNSYGPYISMAIERNFSQLQPGLEVGKYVTCAGSHTIRFHIRIKCFS